MDAAARIFGTRVTTPNVVLVVNASNFDVTARISRTPSGVCDLFLHCRMTLSKQENRSE